jgi:hypothetical protein
MSNPQSNLEVQLKALRTDGENAIASADTLERLEELRVNYLGKKGELSVLLGSMGKLSAEERPKIGAVANTVKEALQASLDKQRNALEQAKIQVQLEAETLDVTMAGIYSPQGRIHPLNGIIDRALDIFIGMGYTVAQGPEMETDYYNFEALNTPPDHPARDMQDTFYLPDGNLLRSQTSCVQIRYMEAEEPPIRIVAPGRVYRKDDVDATHSAVFHQIELLSILKAPLKYFYSKYSASCRFVFVPVIFRSPNQVLRLTYSGTVAGWKLWAAEWLTQMYLNLWVMTPKFILGLLRVLVSNGLQWCCIKWMIFAVCMPAIYDFCNSFKLSISS